jgi:hypothetical protein
MLRQTSGRRDSETLTWLSPSQLIALTPYDNAGWYQGQTEYQFNLVWCNEARYRNHDHANSLDVSTLDITQARRLTITLVVQNLSYLRGDKRLKIPIRKKKDKKTNNDGHYTYN